MHTYLRDVRERANKHSACVLTGGGGGARHSELPPLLEPASRDGFVCGWWGKHAPLCAQAYTVTLPTVALSVPVYTPGKEKVGTAPRDVKLL